MNTAEIFLAVHDNITEVPFMDGTRIVYEFTPAELVSSIQKLLADERERCASICDDIGKAWKKDYQPIRAMAAEDLADIIRKVK